MKDLFPQVPTIRDFFNANHQFIGFGPSLERLFRELDTGLFSCSENYPPYSIKKIRLARDVKEEKPNPDYGPRDFVIEVACAGFSKDQLHVAQNDNILTVQGLVQDDEPHDEQLKKQSDPDIIYKGIAERSWMRRFSISDDLKVDSIKYVNGLLKIYLRNVGTTGTIVHNIE
jgi:molecular chaperone IbpA